MQLSYHISMSLASYCEAFWSGQYQTPDFSQECALCGSSDCAIPHGFYTRFASEPLSGFHTRDLPVLRFLCRGRGERYVDHVTFSLLPEDLIPYRPLSLTFLVLAVLMRMQRARLSLSRVADQVEEELVDMEEEVFFVSAEALSSWSQLLRLGFWRYLDSGLRLLQEVADRSSSTSTPRTDAPLSFQDFLEGAMDYRGSGPEARARGPDVLAGDFFRLAAGPQSIAQFLFGTASQHRRL